MCIFKNPLEEIHKLAVFLGVHVSDEFISDVIEAASLENMRAGSGKTQQYVQLYKQEFEDKSFNAFFRKGGVCLNLKKNAF